MVQINVSATGERIKNMMQDRGLTVKDVQAVCGFTTPQAVYKWIHGQNMPSVDNLVILASLFGTLVDDIVVIEKEQLWQTKTFTRG